MDGSSDSLIKTKYFQVNVLDRIASNVIDYVIFIPFFAIISFFLKRQIKEAKFLDLNFGLGFGAISYILFFCLCFYFFRLLCYILFKKTPGQKAFNIKVLRKDQFNNYKELNFVEFLNRVYYELISLILIFPGIELLYKNDGRIFQDRLSETYMRSRKKFDLNEKNKKFKTLLYKYLTIKKQILFVFIISFLSFFSYKLILDNPFDQKKQSSVSSGCGIVDQVFQDWSDQGFEESRMNAVLALYTAQAIDSECLEKESLLETRLNRKSSEGYLGFGLVYKNDPIFDKMVSKACSGENLYACDLVKTVKEWPMVSLKFSEDKSPLYYKVWKIQQLYAAGFWNESLDLLNKITPRKEIAPFLNQFRVRSLIFLNRLSEAKYAALTTYSYMNEGDRNRFGLWVCKESVRRNCDFQDGICRNLRESLAEQSSPEIIAYDMSEEKCESSEKSNYMSSMESLKIKEIFSLQSNGNFEKAYFNLNQFLKESDFNSTHLIETRLSWIENSMTPESLELLFDDWSSEQKNYRWRLVGDALYKKYISMNDLHKAKNVSVKLKKQYDKDWSGLVDVGLKRVPSSNKNFLEK